MLQSKHTGAPGAPKQKQDEQIQQKGGKGRGTGKEKEMTGNTRSTRSTDAEGSRMSREDIEQLPGQDITDAIEGMRYLESTVLTVPGIPYTADTIAGALFQISMLPGSKTNRANSKAIWAVAFILSEIDIKKKAQTINEVVMGKLDIQMEGFKEETLAIVATIEKRTSKAVDALKEQLAKIADKITENIKAATSGMNDTTTRLTETTTSYRDTLTQPTQQIDNPKSRAREGIRVIQILIDVDPTNNPEAFKNNPILELKKKASAVLKESRGDPQEYKIKAIARLRNGGLLIEFNSKEAAAWLRDNDRPKKFQEEMHKNATIKP
jgi:hypothetical protein